MVGVQQGREKKEREKRVLKGWESGENAQNANFCHSSSVQILSKTRTQNIFDLHLVSLRLLGRRANENSPLG